MFKTLEQYYEQIPSPNTEKIRLEMESYEFIYETLIYSDMELHY